MNPYITKYGDPVITSKGNMATVSGVQEMNNRLVNFFSTQKGSDFILPDYGINMYSLTSSVVGPEKDRIFHTIVSQSLDTDYINQLSSINTISTDITGNTGVITIDLTDADGNRYDTDFEVVA